MGVVNTTYTFSGTDTITSAKLNNIIDDTTFTGDAIQGSTLQVVSPGKLAVNAGGITSNELASNAVVTAKIADSNVTTAKIADSNVTTAKIADSNVTTAKIADASITAAKLNGEQTGSAPIFGCRAYGSFNGQATSPISPIASGNVSTIVRTGTGFYRITMTTPMSSSNYTVVTSAKHAISDTYGTSCDISIVSESQFDIITGKITSGTTYNSQNVNFAVFQ
jgi:hypothetical protein